MTQISLAESVLGDVVRIFADTPAWDVTYEGALRASMIAAIDVLASSPLIGHHCGDDRRALVIGEDAWLCIALYHYDELSDRVCVLAIRSQKESGYLSP